MQKTDEEMAADDRRIFGTSLMRRRADGSMERIDPRDIFIRPTFWQIFWQKLKQLTCR